MKIKIDKSESKGMREFVLIGTSLRAYFIKREENPTTLHAASVYVLMDHRRQGFYIGETGETSGGGFCHRFNSHKSSKKEQWWDLALCFTDTSELFSDERIRKWIESRLNEIAKSEGYLVISTAAASSESKASAEDKLREILHVCWLLGIPWGRDDSVKTEEKTTAKPKEVSIAKKKTKMAVVKKAPSIAERWSGAAQLAKLIAKRAGNEGAANGVAKFFAPVGSKTRKPCTPGSKWRKPLEDAGLDFDKDNFVIDWRRARNPL